MRFWRTYYEEIKASEKSKYSKHSQDSRKLIRENERENKKIDVDYLTKTFLIWLVGGVVSLMPVFTYIWVNQESDSVVEVWLEFFSNKDLFLVITTLTISVLFELMFCEKMGKFHFVLIAIEVILAVFSIHIFSILQYDKDFPYIQWLGVSILSLCIINSIFGYFIVSCRKR